MKTRNRLFFRALSLILAFVFIAGISAEFTPVSEASTTRPAVREARLITNRFIELHWQGQDYINGAGRSKEDPAADHRANFEILLDGNVLVQDEPWYWNITNLLLNGVRVNQNMTTLRLRTVLTNTQMAAVESGASTLEVRILTNAIRASTLSLNVGGLSGSTPMGAIPEAAIGAPGARSTAGTRHNVVFRPYYTNTVASRDGVPVRGSEFVTLGTVELAVAQIDTILSAAPPALNSRLAATSRFLIFGPGEHSFNIPEHRSVFLRDDWNRSEGYGGVNSSTSAAGITRQHVLSAAQRPYASSYATRYRNESILAHEFGHGIMDAMRHDTVANPGSSTHMRGEIEAIYAAVIQMPENPANPDGRLRWQGRTAGSSTYMSRTAHEFVATAVSIWFDAMAESPNWEDDGRGPVNTREELRRYCPQTYNFLTRILPETRALCESWGRDVPNAHRPFFPPEIPEPDGRYGRSVKLMSTLASNPAGSGLQTYIPWNAAANFVPEVELWWDYNTDLMRWHLEPNEDETYFRIVRKLNASYTANTQRSDLVLMPADGRATSGTQVVLSRRRTSEESQWWRFRRQANGSFVITNRVNPELAIVLRNDATGSGTRIELGRTDSESAGWRVDGNVPLVTEFPMPVCEVCDKFEVACVCIFCYLCEFPEADCECVYCEFCGLLDAECDCELCEDCGVPADLCERPALTIVRGTEAAFCEECGVEKSYTVTTLTTFFCDGRATTITTRRAAKRSTDGRLLGDCVGSYAII